MIQYQDLTLRRNGRVLFANASAMIHPSWKVALTGENGAGKSTFFAALLGGLRLMAVHCHVHKVGRCPTWHKKWRHLAKVH
jgi:ATP-binding cassette subfamily F protein 3